MSKVEALIEVVRVLPEHAVDDLLTLANRWAIEGSESKLRPVRLGGIGSGWDTSIEDIRKVRDEMWTRTRPHSPSGCR